MRKLGWTLSLTIALGGAAALAGADACMAQVRNTRTRQTPIDLRYRSALPPSAQEAMAPTKQRSIVILRNQHPELPIRGFGIELRSATMESEQATINDELRQLGVVDVKGFRILNAVSATISKAEAARLAARPDVLAVVPDMPIQLKSNKPSWKLMDPSVPKGNVVFSTGGCPANPNEVILEPEALQVTNAEFQPGSGQPSAHDLVDGSGIKIAILADGLDVNNLDLVRRDASHVVFDFQDFGGDGTNAPTGGAWAFGEASTIAAQGNVVYDLSSAVNLNHPLPPGCNIRIKGMSPGASLAVLNIASNKYLTFASTILQALDYAVRFDHVDVICEESLGLQPYPDQAQDPIALFNSLAVAAGVVVVASSGQAGSSIDSPASGTDVINVGTTTTLRIYQQTTRGAFQLSTGDYLDNNPSTHSARGTSQLGLRTLDVVAPGDLNWAICSTDMAHFQGCGDPDNGSSAPVQVSGAAIPGSGALTAGLVALIIEAYEQSHRGAHPSPSMVKQIIMSSATDLGLPASEQGAGLINALKAVQMARLVGQAAIPPSTTGGGLLVSPASFGNSDEAGGLATFHLEVTNLTGAQQDVASQVRRLERTALSSKKGAITLGPPFNHLLSGGDDRGIPNGYRTVTFHVPTGARVLEGKIAWDDVAQPFTDVKLSLLDPQGRFAISSSPLSGNGLTRVEVHDPQPGIWTAIVWEQTVGNVYAGEVKFSFTTHVFGSIGQVVPPNLTLPPGATSPLVITVPLPSEPGDTANSLVLESSAGITTVPIELRGLVPLKSHGGTFHGLLHGENGEGFFGMENLSYQFELSSGVHSIDVQILLRDSGYNVTGFLVAPDGHALDIQSTLQDDFVSFRNALEFALHDPVAGVWSLVLEVGSFVPGELEEPFTGKIKLEHRLVSVNAADLPHSASVLLKRGVPVTATVTLTNHGIVTKDFFLDPRLDVLGQQALLGVNQITPLPIDDFFSTPLFSVPTDTQQLTVVAAATLPIEMDIAPFLFRGPDIEGTSLPGDTSIATVFAGEVTPGTWSANPVEAERLASGVAFPGSVSLSASALTRLFDFSVSPSSGDAWARAVDPGANYSPLTLAPEQSGTIVVTITPTAPSGTVVSGFLEVDTLNGVTSSGDQITLIPYRYTVQ